MKKFIVPLMLALTMLALVTAASAAPKPTKRDRADAKYYVNAAYKVARAEYRDISTVTSKTKQNLAACADVYANASADQKLEAETEVAALNYFQAIASEYDSFSASLGNRHAKNSRLKAIALNVSTINNELQTYDSPADICDLGQQWSDAGWSKSFPTTWVHEFDVDSGFNNAAFSKAASKIKSQRTALIALGLKKKQAKDFISVATLFI